MLMSYLNKHPGHFYVKVTTAFFPCWISKHFCITFRLQQHEVKHREREKLNARLILLSKITVIH